MLEPGKKQRRGEETQKKILKVALKLFSTKGFNNVTVDKIVKRIILQKDRFINIFGQNQIFFSSFHRGR